MNHGEANIKSVVGALETISARLRALELELNLPANVLGIIDAALAQPATHEPILRRLAFDRSHLFKTIASQVLDEDVNNYNGGYPPIYMTQVERRDVDQADDLNAFLQDVEDDFSSSSSSDQESMSEVVSDECFEDCLGESGVDHDDRARIREDFRAGLPIPEELQVLLDEIRDEKRKEDIEAASTEVLEKDEEVIAEREISRRHLSDLYEEDGMDPDGAKRAQLDEIPDDEIEAMLSEEQDLFEDLVGSDSKDGRLILHLDASIETLDTLINLADAPVTEEMRVLWRKKVTEARQLNDCEDFNADLWEAELAAVRENISLVIQSRPDLKRKRDELEALDEIRAEQRLSDTIFDRKSFRLLVQEIIRDGNAETDIMIDFDATDALQEASEAYLVDLMHQSNLVAIHAGRTFINDGDMKLVQLLHSAVLGSNGLNPK